MSQIKAKPIPGPVEEFTTATGPMPHGITVLKVADGIQVIINTVLPSTMALRLAHMITDAVLGDLHK